MNRKSLAAFISSGDELAFRAPYVRLDSDHPEIVSLLGRLSERTKAQFLLACIRHAWTTHVRYEAGAPAEEDALRLIDDLLDSGYCELPELTRRLTAFQQAFDRIKLEARNGDAAAVSAANVCYVTGVLLAWLYHACVAVSAVPATTWTEYAGLGRRWLPFWLVLDGAASVGGASERAWQAQAMEGFASDAPAEPDVRAPAWIARQVELGPIYLQLWLSAWADKRALIEQYADLTDRTRHLFAKYILVKTREQDTGDAHQRFVALVDANAILLEWCDAALADARALGAGTHGVLDAVFANDGLRQAVESQQP